MTLERAGRDARRPGRRGDARRRDPARTRGCAARPADRVRARASGWDSQHHDRRGPLASTGCRSGPRSRRSCSAEAGVLPRIASPLPLAVPVAGGRSRPSRCGSGTRSCAGDPASRAALDAPPTARRSARFLRRPARHAAGACTPTPACPTPRRPGADLLGVAGRACAHACCRCCRPTGAAPVAALLDARRRARRRSPGARRPRPAHLLVDRRSRSAVVDRLGSRRPAGRRPGPRPRLDAERHSGCVRATRSPAAYAHATDAAYARGLSLAPARALVGRRSRGVPTSSGDELRRVGRWPACSGTRS